jgi:Domain of unknown function (DUF4126)
LLTALLSGFGLAAPAGLNAYIPLLILALADRFSDHVTLDAPYDLISSFWGISALLILLTVELIADKIPGVDHVNDVVQTAIRPAAGAVLVMAETASSDLGDINPALALFIGLFTAGAVHGAKASVRPAVTVSTGGIGNPIISTLEDIVAAVTSIVAIVVPLLLILILPLFAIALWRIYRRLRDSGAALRRLSGKD